MGEATGIRKKNNNKKEIEMPRVKIEVGDREVQEVKTVWTAEEANKLFAEGWSLLHGGLAHKDMLGYQATNCFILARLKK